LSHNLGGFLACTLLGLEILLHVQVTVVLDIFINVRAQVCLWFYCDGLGWLFVELSHLFVTKVVDRL
jgi:uncharacterized membrane protein YdcZ (DUF606 family)